MKTMPKEASVRMSDYDIGYVCNRFCIDFLILGLLDLNGECKTYRSGLSNPLRDARYSYSYSSHSLYGQLQLSGFIHIILISWCSHETVFHNMPTWYNTWKRLLCIQIKTLSIRVCNKKYVWFLKCQLGSHIVCEPKITQKHFLSLIKCD